MPKHSWSGLRFRSLERGSFRLKRAEPPQSGSRHRAPSAVKVVWQSGSGMLNAADMARPKLSGVIFPFDSIGDVDDRVCEGPHVLIALGILFNVNRVGRSVLVEYNRIREEFVRFWEDIIKPMDTDGDGHVNSPSESPPNRPHRTSHQSMRSKKRRSERAVVREDGMIKSVAGVRLGVSRAAAPAHRATRA